jgi:hypothetical protein
MNYRAFVKQQLMTGKMHKVRDVGISAGSHPEMTLNHYHSGGTISHRAVVGPLSTDFESLSVSKSKKTGGRIRKIYDDEPKTGKGVGKKFNSLKFNF